MRKQLSNLREVRGEQGKCRPRNKTKSKGTEKGQKNKPTSSSSSSVT